MKYLIREMDFTEYPILSEFLYEAIFQQETENFLPKSIINEPALKVYIENFGKDENDCCLCAEIDGEIVGAVWTRIIDGYGNIDKDTPEFAISVLKQYRGYGIGTEMMKAMIEYLKKKGYRKASLSVQKDNYAFKLYQKIGFRILDEKAEEYIMIYDLN